MELSPPRYYYHYTSLASWEGIIRQGVIRAGRSGKVFLSPNLYENDAEAEGRLAIVGKPLQCAIRLEASLLGVLAPATRVEPLVDPETGWELIGGGREVGIEGDLPLPVRLLTLIGQAQL